jgi:site-specific DNA-methyltransferase (adenine-specific)
MVLEAENMRVLPSLPDASFTVVYLDPPFNTGRAQARRTTRHVPHVVVPPADDSGADLRVDTAKQAKTARLVTGFQGKTYERILGRLVQYDDQFDDYWGFLAPRLTHAWRLLTGDGTLYLHLDYREAHYAKVLLDALFGRAGFLNEIIWAYDYGGKARRRWPAKHDTILVYVKDPTSYYFDNSSVDRIPYMAPGLVTPEKAARGKLPTDVWWHTIVSPTGKEKTGYPTQKPEALLRRMLQASSRPGDWVLDFFAGSGTTGAAAAALDRRFVLVDENPEAVAVMRRRLAAVPGVQFRGATSTS